MVTLADELTNMFYLEMKTLTQKRLQEVFESLHQELRVFS